VSTFTFKKDTKAAESAGQGGGINTGVFVLQCLGVVLEFDKKENPRANFYFSDKDGKRAVVFGMMIAEKWTSGSENYDYKKWQEAAQLLGVETGATAAMELQTSKDKKETKTVFTETVGKWVTVALQQKFDIQKEGKKAGQAVDEKGIYRTFDKEGRTLAEIQQGTEAKYSKELAKTLTPYETKQYKNHIANGGAKPGATKSVTPAASAPQEEATADDVL